MNGASVLIVFVLVVALGAGMVFLVDQLNRSAAEIMANRAELQALQHALDEAQADQTRQQQLLAQQTAALQQKDGELDLARQALAAAQADVSALQQRLNAEQAARAAAEAQIGTLNENLRAAQSQLAEKTAAQIPTAAPAAKTGSAAAPTAGLPLALSAGGLLLAGGILAWGRHERHLVVPGARDHGDDGVVVRMTRAQAHAYAGYVRGHAGRPTA